MNILRVSQENVKTIREYPLMAARSHRISFHQVFFLPGDETIFFHDNLNTLYFSTDVTFRVKEIPFQKMLQKLISIPSLKTISIESASLGAVFMSQYIRQMAFVEHISLLRSFLTRNDYWLLAKALEWNNCIKWLKLDRTDAFSSGDSVGWVALSPGIRNRKQVSIRSKYTTMKDVFSLFKGITEGKPWLNPNNDTGHGTMETIEIIYSKDAWVLPFRNKAWKIGFAALEKYPTIQSIGLKTLDLQCFKQDTKKYLSHVLIDLCKLDLFHSQLAL